ncbi:MAG TPA: MFS transporter [Longimicrobiales bacterium]
MSGRRAWVTLALLSVAELLGMSLWFTASAASPELAQRWSLDATQVSWLTTAVQVGFVAGTAFAAFTNTADIVPARTWFVASALLGAAANLTLPWSSGLASALGGRFATGFFLAGVYPPAMKMIATWFRERRGLAIGTVVAALTIGKATPYLLEALPGRSLMTIASATSAAAALAALLVALGYRDGPHAFERRPFSWRLAHDVWHDRPTRLAIAGYLGHMWELYAMWALIALFFADAIAAGGGDVARAGLFGFAAIAAGGAGAVLAGVWADRLGRERIASRAMFLSGACSLVIGWLLDAPLALVAIVALVWGFAIVADSAQFSALVTELAPRHAVGTALTLQTSLGFALTAVAIPFTATIAARFGWGIAFSQLAIGPALGIVAMHRLRTTRST